jgi:hypothetical protein
MKDLLCILLLLCGLPAAGQQYFNKRDPVHSFSSYFTNVLERNGRYYCIGSSVDSSNYTGNDTYLSWPGIRFVVYDGTGNKLVDTFYQRNDRWMSPWETSLHSLPGGDLVFTISSYLDTIACSNVLRMDSLGHVVSEVELAKPMCPENAYWEPSDLQPTGTGEWLMLSNISCNGSVDAILTKFDSSFNVRWHKLVYTHYMNDFYYDLLIVPDGYVLAGGRNSGNISWNYYTCRAELVKTDTAGNPQWSWLSHADSLTNYAQDVIKTQDGGYIYCGGGSGYEQFVSSTVGELYFRSWIEKVDSNGNVVWNRVLAPRLNNIGLNQQEVVKELPDGSLVVAGTIASGFEIQDSISLSYGSLVKLASDGSIIWRRLYQAPEGPFLHSVSDMTQTTDGGFVLVGNTSFNTAWIIKVDSNGCEQGVGQCNPSDIEQLNTESRNAIKVYPNPTDGLLYVESDTQTEYRLLNLTGICLQKGQLHKGRNELDSRALPPGLYLLQAGNEVIKVVKE